ncbi:hypothetical protein Goklo_009294, partial [Gossypium klotzschianum]|nr:hypothetical protein [Gossypium klotzschianum]
MTLAHQRGPDIHLAYHQRPFNHQVQREQRHSHPTQQFDRRYPRHGFMTGWSQWPCSTSFPVTPSEPPIYRSAG